MYSEFPKSYYYLNFTDKVTGSSFKADPIPKKYLLYVVPRIEVGYRGILLVNCYVVFNQFMFNFSN